MLLAQGNFDAVPASTLKWVLVILVVLLGVVALIVGIWASVAAIRSKEQKRVISPQPLNVSLGDQPLKVEKVPRRFNYDLCETRHSEVDRRLNGHDAEINSLWNTVRAEDTAIRKEMRDQFSLIERSLGRIEGKLDNHPSTKHS